MNSIPSVKVQPEKRASRKADEVLAWLLDFNFALAILSLWIQAFWPVALFEIGSFAIAFAVLLSSGEKPHRLSARFPLFVLGWVILWGCLQLIADGHLFALKP